VAERAGGAEIAPPVPHFTKLAEADMAKPYPHVHEGDGTISLRYFRFDNSPAPANFVVYDMPPGSSEGVHTHQLGDAVLGSYDEYYYVIEGQGEMEVDGEIVPVKAGDHVHTPLGVAHGIRNTQTDRNLRVFLTFITRTA
jgi:quercetin dioxygenase-like cupin family protein